MSSSSDQFTALAPFYDELMVNVPYPDWVDYVLKLCTRFKHWPTRILDCACGTGNVSYELARRGFKVTGVDFSEEMIDVARQKTTLFEADFGNSIPPQFIQADLCTIDLERQFDTITCLYDSLNYITAPELLQRAFTQIRKHLRPGGLFIFDLNAVYAFEADLFTQSDHQPRKKLQYDWLAHYDRQTRLCRVEMTYRRSFDDGSIMKFREVHCERAYSMTEIKQLLKASGWTLLECFDAYRLSPPHARTERWFFVASNLDEK